MEGDPTRPLPLDRGSRRAPSFALATIFTLGLASLVLPLLGFVASITAGWQAGLDLSTKALRWSFYVVGAVLAYGFAVGVYHTFLAVTGLDRRRRRT